MRITYSQEKEEILKLAEKVDELMKQKGVDGFLPCDINIYEADGLKLILSSLERLPDKLSGRVE